MVGINYVLVYLFQVIFVQCIIILKYKLWESIILLILDIIIYKGIIYYTIQYKGQRYHVFKWQHGHNLVGLKEHVHLSLRN
jgi:hypothetical protein